MYLRSLKPVDGFFQCPVVFSLHSKSWAQWHPSHATVTLGIVNKSVLAITHVSLPFYSWLHIHCLSSPRTHSALQCWCQRQALGSSASASISSLMQDVVQHEEAILEAMKRAQERPIPSVGDVSEGVEDLEMAMDQEPPEAQACSKTDCCKKDTHCSKEQSACSSIALVGLEELVTRCANLATELELPEEFVCHIQQLKTYGHWPSDLRWLVSHCSLPLLDWSLFGIIALPQLEI